MAWRIIGHLTGRLGLAAASLLLVMASMAKTEAQDDIKSDLEIVGASFKSPVDPAGSVTVDVTVRNSGNSMAPGSETSDSSYMIDVVLSTGRISNTNDLAAGAAQGYFESSWLPSDTPPGD